MIPIATSLWFSLLNTKLLFFCVFHGCWFSNLLYSLFSAQSVQKSLWLRVTQVLINLISLSHVLTEICTAIHTNQQNQITSTCKIIKSNKRKFRLLSICLLLYINLNLSPATAPKKLDRPKTRCVKCVPKCASVCVASSNIVYYCTDIDPQGKVNWLQSFCLLDNI